MRIRSVLIVRCVMSDEEYMRNIKNVNSEELIENMRYYGTDAYYQDLWECTLNEIKRRLCEVRDE